MNRILRETFFAGFRVFFRRRNKLEVQMRRGRKMKHLAIDVGSGITKVCSEEGRVQFPSLAGIPDCLDRLEFEFKETKGATVEFNRKTYVTGERAMSLVHPDKLVRTTDDQWFDHDGYMALLYAAMAEALPQNYNGKVAICTGLPQASFSRSKEALVKKLAAKHSFRVNNVKYSVHIRKQDVQVMPQVMGLFLSRLALDTSLQLGRVALLDVGTYTSDWTLLEDCKTQHWAAGGSATGVSNVIHAISRYLREELLMNCSDSTITKALRDGRIRRGNSWLPLGDQIADAVMDCSAEMIESVDRLWKGAKDATMIVGGGGSRIFGPAISVRFPHARIISDPEPVFSIVTGYFVYMQQRQQQHAA